MPHPDADTICRRGMHDVDFAKWFDLATFDSNRIFCIDCVALGTVTCRRSHDNNLTQWQQCIVQSGKPGSVKSIVVRDQKLHGKYALMRIVVYDWLVN